MLEKLIQAAFITFLLQLIAILSNTSPIRTKGILTLAEKSVPVISSTFQISSKE
jgi:hypothetical protein